MSSQTLFPGWVTPVKYSLSLSSFLQKEFVQLPQSAQNWIKNAEDNQIAILSPTSLA